MAGKESEPVRVKFRELRERVIAAGIKTLSDDELREEIAERRGGSQGYRALTDRELEALANAEQACATIQRLREGADQLAWIIERTGTRNWTRTGREPDETK